MGQRVFEGREHRDCYFFSVSLSPPFVLRIFDPRAAFHVQCFHQFVGIDVCKFHVTPQSALGLNFNFISQSDLRRRTGPASRSAHPPLLIPYAVRQY
jgi:hypothetical protein